MTVAGAGVAAAVEWHPWSESAGRDLTSPDLQPVYRWRLRNSAQGWAPVVGSVDAEMGHDPAGWLAVRGAGHLAVQSPRPAGKRCRDWRLDDRPNGDRLTFSVQVDGPGESYPLVVHLAWLGAGGAEETADSASLTVPTGVPVDIDTWWDCRGTAPHDVLQRVRGVGLSLESGTDDVVWRIRDVRQPPSTIAWGAKPDGVGAMFRASAPRGLPEVETADPYQELVVSLLSTANTWSVRNNRLLHIGEWAWPKESRTDEDPTTIASDAAYAALTEQWLRQADRYAVPYTPWGESGYWGGSAAASPVDYGTYPDACYFCGSPEATSSGVRAVTRAKPSADLLESHTKLNPRIPPSINVVGMCFTYLQDGTQYSTTNIGVRGQDYLAEAPETLRFLHERGYRVFRLPFRWDRVMRKPDDKALDPSEWGYVEDAIETILDLPDTAVIIDVHCGGLFLTSPDPDDLSVPATINSIDGPTGLVSTQMFVDFWLLMSRRLRSHSKRLVYELANEPRDTNPYIVRRWTQSVVAALRDDGDSTFCLIPSYPYDNISRAFTEVNHPFPWIQDPLGTFHHAYTLHQYFDYDQSGQYALTYDDTLAKLS